MQSNILLSVTFMVLSLMFGTHHTWAEEHTNASSLSRPIDGWAAAVKDANAANITKSNSESFGDAVVRVNRKLAKEYSVLCPKMLTVATLQRAIERAIEEFSEGISPDREFYIATFTKMLETKSIPPSTLLDLSVIRHRNKGYDQKYAPSEYTNTVSLNYCFSVRNQTGTGIRIIGLPKLAEGFDVVRKNRKDSTQHNLGQTSEGTTDGGNLVAR